MDDSLYFGEQHLQVREMVRQFARDEVAPIAAKHDAEATFPWESIRKMGELGLLGIPWPEELGGAGLDLISYMIVIQELAKVDASHGLTVSAHTTLGTSPIVRFGTDQQKKKFVPLLASGRVLGGFGLTEPDAGSDAAGTKSTAVRRGRWCRPRADAASDERISRGQEGGQAWVARVGHVRAHHGGCGSSSRESLGKRGGGVQELHANSRLRSRRHRRTVGRHRRGCVRGSAQIRQYAKTVRPNDR